MFELMHNFWFLVAVTVIVCSVTATIAQVWQKVRRGEQELALKQEMLRRGMSAEEMERVLRAGSGAHEKPAATREEKAVEQLVAQLGESGVAGRVVEQVLAAVRAADPAIRGSLCRAVTTLLANSSLEGDERDEQILAVVRGLSVPSQPVPAEDEPPAVSVKPEETFQPVRPV